MSFDYLNDEFGVFRKGRITRFTELENRTKDLFEKLYFKKQSYNKFDEEFTKIIDLFLELTEHSFDEDTPIWINKFAASVFLRWKEWHILRVAHDKYPEKFNTPELEAQYKHIESKNYDQWLLSKIKYCLDSL